MSEQLRAKILSDFGADGAIIDELLAYNANVFDYKDITSASVNLAPETHITAWQKYAEEAAAAGVLPTLRQNFVQFRFPIKSGISQAESYRKATRQGIPPSESALRALDAGDGVVLHRPDLLQLKIYDSLVGLVPVIISGQREDFEVLVQALAMRNEPLPVPPSMGACLVKGFNNWQRVQTYRQQWEAKRVADSVTWQDEFQRLIPYKELYQDRFIILSDGPYSNVTAQQVGLSQEKWQALSLEIRTAHEATHYFTLRVYNAARNNILDEIIADYFGLVTALGYFRADWLRLFMGLEHSNSYREGGRLQNYLGQPPLSGAAFQVLQLLVRAAAFNLEEFDLYRRQNPGTNLVYERTKLLLTLTRLTLEEMAASHGTALLRTTWEQLS